MSRITATYTETNGVGAYTNGAAFCAKVPAVIYQPRLGGAATRVQRDGKGDHLTLIRDGRTELIVCSTGGVVGRLGYSHHADAWCVEIFGALNFAATDHRDRGSWTFHTSREDAIGEAGLTWLI